MYRNELSTTKGLEWFFPKRIINISTASAPLSFTHPPPISHPFLFSAPPIFVPSFVLLLPPIPHVHLAFYAGFIVYLG
jgi:hypothetical protein